MNKQKLIRLLKNHGMEIYYLGKHLFVEEISTCFKNNTLYVIVKPLCIDNWTFKEVYLWLGY